MTTCARVSDASLEQAFGLLLTFLSEDEHYLDSRVADGDGGAAAVRAGLEQFLDRPELGFVWLASQENEAVGVCVVSFAVSTSAGGLVAKLDDVYVQRDRQGEGVGSALFDTLKDALRGLGVLRIDTSVHVRNKAAKAFYETRGFVPLNEEGLAFLFP